MKWALLPFTIFVFVSTSQAQVLCRNVQFHNILEAYLASYEAMKPHEIVDTVGVETELSVPRSLGLKGLADRLLGYFQNRHSDTRALHQWKENTFPMHSDSFLIEYQKDSQKYRYEVTHDYSVNPSNAATPVEIVSPILRDRHDIETYLGVIDYVRQLGGKEDVNTAGMHVHFGFPNPKIGEIHLLGALSVKLDAELTSRFMITQTRKPYIQPVSETMARAYLRGDYSNMDPIEFLKTFFQKKESRFLKVNFRALLKQSTVEVRWPNSTLNTKVQSFIIDLVRRLNFAVRTKDPELVKVMTAKSLEDITLNDLLDALRIPRSEMAEIESILRPERDLGVRKNWVIQFRKALGAPYRIWHAFLKYHIGHQPGGAWVEKQQNQEQ